MIDLRLMHDMTFDLLTLNGMASRHSYRELHYFKLSVIYCPFVESSYCLRCFDTVGWASGPV